MSTTVIAGKPSNTVGEKDSTLVLRGSSIKIQWGNKFIDLIKNGKINTESKENVLKKADSIDEAVKDGVYLIGEEVWFVFGGTKVNLTGTSDDLCVSFLREQEATSEQKYQALTNIGFYYDTLQDAQDITAGIIYIASEGKLYIAKDGKFSEYKQEQTLERLDELIIGDLKIHKDKGIMTITSPNLNIMDYLVFKNETILANKDLSVNGYLQSPDATSEYGYRLYMLNGKSILEVDEIIERSKLGVKEQQVLELNDVNYYSKHNNVITEVAELGNGRYKCSLKYTNQFDTDYVYVLMPIAYTAVAEIINSSLNQSTIKVYIQNGFNVDITTQITVEYDQNQSTIVTIPAGYNNVLKTINDQAVYAKCIDSSNNKVSITNINPKKIAYEFPVVIDGQYIIITIQEEAQQLVFLNNCINALVCDSINPYIQIDDNNLDLLDRSRKIKIIENGIEKEIPDPNFHTRVGVIDKEAEPILTSLKQIEEVSEEDELPRPNIGIYSDNFTGLNPLLYNTIFNTAGYYDKETEHPKYPKYSEEIKLPKEDNYLILDKKFNLAVPNLQWIKQMLDLFIPVGTIIMFNGQSEIPPGWVICNKENSELYDNVPDLTGKFIKSDIKLGPNEVDKDLDEDNNLSLTLSESNLPEHHHPHQKHRHGPGDLSGIAKDSGDLTIPLVWEDYLWDLQFSQTKTDVIAPPPSGENISSTPTTSVVSDVSVSARTQGGDTEGGNHIHSVDITNGNTEYATSQEVANQSWANNPLKFKIEPHAYSLIFIIKVQPFAEFLQKKNN